MEEDAHVEAAPAVLESNDQKHLKEFILLLETLPEVWDSSNVNSINKVKRANAYEQLLIIFKRIKPGATTKDVIAKINSLKSNYRKELKKITDSKRSGAAAENVYTPKSWVFHTRMLNFLNKTEKPIDVNAFSENEEQSEPSFSSMREPAPPAKKLKKGPVAKQNELLEKACNYLSQTSHKPVSPTVSFPDIDPSALYWTQRLKKLKPTQRLLAEKAINEILFEAELEALNRNSVQINNSSPVLDRFVSPVSGPSPSPNSVYTVYAPSPSPNYSNSLSLQSQSVTSPENCVAVSTPQTNDKPSFAQITTGVPSNLIITNTNNIRRHSETSYTLHIPSTSDDYSDYTVGSLFSSYKG